MCEACQVRAMGSGLFPGRGVASQAWQPGSLGVSSQGVFLQPVKLDRLDRSTCYTGDWVLHGNRKPSTSFILTDEPYMNIPIHVTSNYEKKAALAWRCSTDEIIYMTEGVRRS